MRKMKNSKIGWINEIPYDWEIIKGKYLFINDKVIVGSKVDEYDRLALTLQGVIKRSKDDNEGLQPDKFNSYQILKENELVFKLIDLQNISTSRVGLSPYTGIVSPAYIILKCTDKIYPEFAEKYYLMMWMNKIFNDLGDSGVRSSLNARELLELPIILPPLVEQKNIAIYLNKECEKIDSIYKDVEKQIETLEQYKRSIIAEVVTKGIKNVEFQNTICQWIPHIPKNWILKRAKYCFATRTTKGNEINLELLSPTQKFGVIPQSLYEKYSNMVTVKINEKNNLQTFRTIYIGDYCISLRSFEGGFEYSRYNGVVSPAYTVFFPTIKCDRRYYKFLFKIQPFIAEMNSYSLSLRDGKPISFDDFGNTLIPIPPLCEQKEIAKFLDKKCAEINSIIEDKKKQLVILEEYKKSLIYEYVTGKKEVPCE